MKIALCMSGHSRSHERTVGGWSAHLLSRYDVDVFFHLWDTDGYRATGENTDGHSGVIEGNKIDVSKIQSLWKPAKIVIEQYSLFHDRFKDRADKWYAARNERGLRVIDRPLSNFSMLYKWHECNQMMLNSGTKYDAVIRTRPDMGLNGPISEEHLQQSDNLLLPRKGSWAADEPSDYMTIGTPELMTRWCDMYNQLDTKYENSIAEGDFSKALHIHRLFHYHLIDNNIPFRVIDVDCEIVR